DALRPGGLLFYQTFTRERVDDDGPSTARFRLETNELLRLFPGLILRFYRDEGRVGDTARGFRNYAQMIAQRPC
ncbi:MAG: SAM-dependent methyltransferase, partial [Sedimenticolaceae bacterium]